MAIGPIQIVVVSFERIDQFKGEILKELQALSTQRVVRIIDVLFVAKDEYGNTTILEDNDLNPEEAVEYGSVISHLLGLGPSGEENRLANSVAGVLAAAENDFGLSLADIEQVKARLLPGTATLILLLEHAWVIGLYQAVHNTGGRLVAQGLLNQEVLASTGAEV